MSHGAAPDPTRRFSNRVDYYVKYRPGYPAEIIGFLQKEMGLSPASVVADVGSGTGILTELFLKHGNLVYGVEPNREMRQAAERLLRGYPRFRSVTGAAEATTLDAGSVDFVTAGQAFHWFDAGRARVEFWRILRPDGWVVLIWNARRSESTPFLRDYEALLRTYALDYKQVTYKRASAEVRAEFFGRGGYQAQHFDNYQLLDYDALQGRLLSSSYAPLPGHPNHEPSLAALRRIFDAHQAGGVVKFEYDTVLYYGRLTGAG